MKQKTKRKFTSQTIYLSFINCISFFFWTRRYFYLILGNIVHRSNGSLHMALMPSITFRFPNLSRVLHVLSRTDFLLKPSSLSASILATTNGGGITKHPSLFMVVYLAASLASRPATPFPSLKLCWTTRSFSFMDINYLQLCKRES